MLPNASVNPKRNWNFGDVLMMLRPWFLMTLSLTYSFTHNEIFIDFWKRSRLWINTFAFVAKTFSLNVLNCSDEFLNSKCCTAAYWYVICLRIPGFNLDKDKIFIELEIMWGGQIAEWSKLSLRSWSGLRGREFKSRHRQKIN